MHLADFDYILPPELIAQKPFSPRDHSRLMVLDRKKKSISHHFFYELPHILPSETVIVLNNTKVFKARLFASFTGEQKICEVFLLEKVGNKTWKCLANPAKKFFPGKELFFQSAEEHTSSVILKARVISILEEGMRVIEFNQEIEPVLDIFGNIPLPPYVKEKASFDMYQTTYAKKEGSVAAPTAGLHFTEKTFSDLQKKGIDTREITLHVGIGTFRPIQADDIISHTMHYESYVLDEYTAAYLNNAKKEGKKVLSVGTTSTRVLEHCSDEQGVLHPMHGHTNLFVYPGYKFRFVDQLLTNFHLPKSTLLLLISAFADREFIMQAYQEAIEKKYRFYSFGDAMLIL